MNIAISNHGVTVLSGLSWLHLVIQSMANIPEMYVVMCKYYEYMSGGHPFTSDALMTSIKISTIYILSEKTEERVCNLI